MTFLAPGFLVAATGAALGILALHFIVTRRPRAVPFPTARFVPDLPATSRSRSFRLSDLLLLMVRVLTVLFAGAAFARPVLTPARERVARVILADVSGVSASLPTIRDSVRAQFRNGDAIVEFDTTSRPVRLPDSVGTRTRVAGAGVLSAGIVSALRTASTMRAGTDSLELVIVSPALSGEVDRATAALRKQWHGRARLVVVQPLADTTRQIVYTDTGSELRAPSLAIRRTREDTVGAVVAGDDVVVARFDRVWRYAPDSLAGTRVVARWVDGEPAAVSRITSRGCELSTAIAFDSSGDLLLQPAVARFRRAMYSPCTERAGATTTKIAQMLEGSGQLARAADFAPPVDVDSPLARWFAIAALLLAVGEMVMRWSPGTSEQDPRQ